MTTTLSPPTLPYSLTNLVNISTLQELMDALYEFAAVPTAILDADGTILTATGWQDICVKYHRVHPETACRCSESDSYIAKHLANLSVCNGCNGNDNGNGHSGHYGITGTTSYVIYECANGLVDAASPILIRGVHVGTLFTGQFLLAAPDTEFFRRQAARFGFDEYAYIDALGRVPVVPRERIEPIMRYLSLLTTMIAEMGLQRLQQHELQEKIQASEERFRAIANYTYDWETWVAQDGSVQWINPTVERITGYRVEECLAMQEYPFLMIHEDDRPGIRRALAEARQGSSGDNVTFRLIHRDGSLRWMGMSWQPAFGSNGHPMGYRMSVRDYTQRKRDEETMLRLGRILDDSTEEIYVFDSDTLRFIQVNRGAQQNLGYTMEELASLTPLDINPDIDPTYLRASIESLQTDSCPTLAFEGRHRRKDGSIYPVSIRLHSSDDEESRMCVAIVQDITEMKRAEMERARLQEQIIAAQQAAIQELSTPLLPIADHVVALPLVGSIDSARSQQIMETLLEGIAQYHATIAIIDITGVRTVDTHVAQTLIHTAQAVRLLGAQVVLSGVHPHVAQTLVELGADLSGLVTRRTLQDGIAYALRTPNNAPKQQRYATLAI